MATIITVQGKVINIPKTPYLVQTDKASEKFQFLINNPAESLADCDFYLAFKTAKNTASIQTLSTKSVDPTTGVITLDWTPNEEFTAVNGYTEIQLKAMIGQTFVWNSTKATVYVFNELLNTAAAMVNPNTPTLFLYYLHVMQGLRDEVVGLAKLESSLTATYKVGGVASGTVFPAGTTLLSIINQILSGNVPPTPPEPDKIYYGITNSIPSLNGLKNPASGEQISTESINESVKEYPHAYNNGTSLIAQYWSIAYPASLGDLIHIYDEIGSDNLGNFTKVVDGTYNIYYKGNLWSDVNTTIKYVRA